MPGPYRSCEVELTFADADYTFRLPIKRIAELEEKCQAPIGTIWKRVLTSEYHAVDLVETVRIGLIGGGLEAQEARTLIERYCDVWPLEIWHAHATAILSACIIGYEAGEESDAPKDEAAGEDTSTSPQPTRSASKKASARKKSAT